ncbi:hypothetical protein O181_053147 [Austropuccinia psidii MF-1]|uniref:Uncharacterized protein n=1 Tax=Austropuccinia psidii MF-1 TaxID=1389203 RepID=A0A9Q3HR83_9BASI|nr:hypothetical protein [Austropuccinia psidii MF-1]
MDQQSTSDLPPLPHEDTGEDQYDEESEEEDQNFQIESLMKKMQDIISTKSKKKGKRRGSTSYTLGGSPKAEPRPQTHQRRALLSTPTNPSPFQHEILRQERPVVKIKAKDYNPNFNGEEVEKIAHIKGAGEESLAIEMEYWTTDSKISDSIEAIPGYEEGNWNQLKKDLITKWGRVEPERRYRKDSRINLFSDT